MKNVVETAIVERLERDEVLEIYRANGWSSAKKPDALMAALEGSHTLVAARLHGRLVGLANAISDGHLVVCYPHLLVHPEFHRQGIGRALVDKLQKRYSGYHQQILLADGDAVKFYESLGFERAGRTVPMWIYQGDEH